MQCQSQHHTSKCGSKGTGSQTHKPLKQDFHMAFCIDLLRCVPTSSFLHHSH